MRNVRFRIHGQKGMTLVELVASMAVLGIVLPGIVGVVRTAVRSTTDTQNRSILQTQARAALDVMSQDIRQSYQNNGAAAFTVMNANQITFYSPDRLTPWHLRQVSYAIQNGELDKAVATSTNTNGPPWTIGALGPWIKQVGSIANTSGFVYHDQNGAVTASPSALRAVIITLNVIDSTSKGRPFSFVDTVAPRNLQ